MNKRLIALMASIGLLAGVAPAANAATSAPGPFTVKVSLDSTCTAAAAVDLDFGTYTAITGGASSATPSATIAFTCTRGLAGTTAAFDNTNGYGSAASATPTGNGVIAGLLYTLTAAIGTGSAGTAPTAGASPTLGTAATVNWVVTGGMAANQAGTCANATCAATQARTLTYTF